MLENGRLLRDVRGGLDFWDSGKGMGELAEEKGERRKREVVVGSEVRE